MRGHALGEIRGQLALGVDAVEVGQDFRHKGFGYADQVFGHGSAPSVMRCRVL